MSGNAAKAEIHLILRDFDMAGLESHGTLLQTICAAIQAGDPRAKIECKIEKQYRNMRYWLENDTRAVDLAVRAMKSVGVEPAFELVRGGTDGSQLTEKGIPTPNIFTGMQIYMARSNGSVCKTWRPRWPVVWRWCNYNHEHICSNPRPNSQHLLAAAPN